VIARLVYALFAIGGFSALVYEVLWMRSFRLVFGSSTRSAAAVLAAYFGGMALGAWIGARLAARGDPLRRYGWAELAIGGSALGVWVWLALFERVYPALYAACGGPGAPLTLAKLCLAGLALAPPAAAMGATLPLVAQALVLRPEHVARRTGLLYAFNTAGAAAGALLAGFVLPPTLGVRAALLVAVSLSTAVGLAALALARRTRGAAGWASEPPVAPPDARPAPVLLFAAAFSGFGVLALEVLFVRLLSQRSEGSVYTFGLMLAIFLLALAAGSLWVARRLDRGDEWRFLARTQTAAVVAILLAPLLFQWIPLFTLFSRDDSLAVRLLRFGAGAALVLGPAVCLIGVVLPATWKLAAGEARAVGAQVGRLAATSTAAGVAGSLAAGFVLLPQLGLGASLLAVAGLYAMLAALAWVRAGGGARRFGLAALPLVAVAAWAAVGPWRIHLQPLSAGERLLLYRDGEAASLAVIEQENGNRSIKLDHAYLLGSSSAAGLELRQGRLPLLLHPDPRRVAFIGVATGITASAVLDFPVERAVAVELVPGVVDALPHFARWNGAFFRDPRTRIAVDDGRNFLLGTGEHFDVIVSDLFVPWHAGTGDLYSLEHFRAAARRLAPGGLFVQWLPAYQLDVLELRAVTATFLGAFPHAQLWRADFDADQPLLALVGAASARALDPESLRAACARLAAASRPAPFLGSPSGLLLLYLADSDALQAWAHGAPQNTDDRPFIEYSTPGSLLRHRQREVDAVQEELARFRPRALPGAEKLALARPAPELFRLADLLHDATLARLSLRFERELRILEEVARTAGDLEAVRFAVGQAAEDLRRRGHVARSEALLTSLGQRGPGGE